MALRNSSHSPLRLPVIPVRLPAFEMSWHGNPPLRMSGRGTVPQSTVVMSGYRVTFGQCFSKTFRQYGSHSTCQIVLIPTRSKPRSKPPIPEKREPCVKSIHHSSTLHLPVKGAVRGHDLDSCSTAR